MILQKEEEKLIFDVIIAGLFGYSIGSIFISYFWGKIKGLDLTQIGTGQLGATNAGRAFGWPIMIIAGFFDMFKATFALLIIWVIYGNVFPKSYYEIILAASSIGILIGHVKSIWIWFDKHEWHGGKGGGPLGGILLFISWQSFLLLYIFFMGILQGLKRLMNKKSLYNNFLVNTIVIAFIPFVVYWISNNLFYVFLILILEGLIVFFERKKVINIITELIS